MLAESKLTVQLDCYLKTLYIIIRRTTRAVESTEPGDSTVITRTPTGTSLSCHSRGMISSIFGTRYQKLLAGGTPPFNTMVAVSYLTAQLDCYLQALYISMNKENTLAIVGIAAEWTQVQDTNG